MANMTPRTSPSTVSDVTKKQQIADRISHLGKSDPRLHSALTSLQSQNNQLAENVKDLSAAIQQLTSNVSKVTGHTVQPPAVPGSGGFSGGNANSAGAGENTMAIPPKVSEVKQA
jgi:TolA-binding protein